MTKQYKYIGTDKSKQNWIAKGKKYELSGNMYTVYNGEVIVGNNIWEGMIEREPTLREEIKEDIFEKINNDLGLLFTPVGIKQLKYCIKKNLGITKDEIYEYFTSGSLVDTRQKIEKFFLDRGLLLD